MVEDKDMARTPETGPKALPSAKAELPQILNTRDFDFKVSREGGLDRLTRKGEEDRHTALAKLHDIHDFIHISEEAYKAFNIYNAASRNQLMRICGRLSAILDSLPTFLDTKFASQFKRPKEQALLEQIRLQVVVQNEIITRFLAQVEAHEEKLRMYSSAAVPVVEKGVAPRRRIVDRLPKSALHFARNIMVVGFFAATSSAAAQADADTQNPDQLDRTSIVFNDNLSENGEAADSAFTREMTTLIQDIGGIGGFINRLEEMMVEMELSAVEGALSEITTPTDETVEDTTRAQSQAATPTVPPQEVKPEVAANIRKGPKVDSADEGDVDPNSFVSVVSKYTYPNDEKWLEVINDEGIRGWVRSDLLTEPSQEVVEVSDLENIPVRGTDKSIIDLAADQEAAGKRLVIELGDIRNAYEDFKRGLPAGTFEPGVLEIISRDGKVFGQTRDVEFTDSQGRLLKNEAGSVLTISYRNGDTARGEDPNRLYLLPFIYGPGQLRDQLMAGAAMSGVENYQFTGENTPSGYLRFGNNVIFNYDQASLALMAGVTQEHALLQFSFILREGSYPDSMFAITEEGEQVFITFETGERFEATFTNGVWEVKRVEGAPAELNRLTAIEFPESATHLSDRATVPISDSESTQVRVFTDHRDTNVDYKLIPEAWDAVSNFVRLPFEKAKSAGITTIQVPIVYTDAATKGVAPRVDENGNFENGMFIEISVEELLQKGINLVVERTKPPITHVPGTNPDSTPTYGMVSYIYEEEWEPDFAYRIDKNTSQGLTLYIYINDDAFKADNPDFYQAYFAGMIFPGIVLEDFVNDQIKAQQELGDNASLANIRQHMLDAFYRQESGESPWAKFYRDNSSMYDRLFELSDGIQVTPVGS